MLCYRDRSWCSQYGQKCANADCDRAITPAVRKAAIAWWGNENFPIAVANLWDNCKIRKEIQDGQS